PISIDNAVRALASFERTIVSGRSRVDRFLDGDTAALSEAERRGLVLLGSERLGCRTCHGGFAFTAAADRDVPFFNTGLYDVDGRGGYPARDRGLYEITGDPADVGRFKPPTLRNLALTAPYMHDGSVATLGEVLDIYARGGRRIASGPDAGDGATSPRKSPLIRGFALSAAERADLLAAFDALTDEQLAADPALSDPW
ncbi:MAG: di-heme enzyme, partial [Kofleriaceae bacterium]